MSNESNEQEIWKTYPKYPWIEASNLGRIRTVDHWVTCKNNNKRLIKGRILKQQLDGHGYLYVSFGMNGKQVTLKVHRAVASSHLPNPNNLPEVNHIDCDPTNNRLDNLEWCTHQENIAYCVKLGHWVNNNPGHHVFAVDLKTGKILRFESQREAARQLGVNQPEICAVVNGKKYTAGGCWFTEDESEITEEKIKEIKANMHFHGGVIAVNTETFEVFYFESQREASRQLGVNQGHIGTVARDKRNETGGHWFCYADENAIEKTRAKFGDEVAEKVEELMRDIKDA